MIERYGWTEDMARDFAPHASEGNFPGRITVQHRDSYLVITDEGELRSKISGRLMHEAEEAGHPAVGDWVALAPNVAEGTATIHAVLPRRTAFVRRGAIDSSHGMQVIAANIDVAFVVTSLNADLNARRIERYMAAAWQSGAWPVVVLTKSDLAGDGAAEVAEIEALAPDCDVIAVSAKNGVGLQAVLAQLPPGETGVLIGSSGVGKSTLVNALLGHDLMATQDIRDGGDQGRHTTSHRQLILLPGGGLILDTPGFREVGLVDADEGVSVVFDDIETLIQTCRFNDCSHEHEPGCAVVASLNTGTLDRDRWDNFCKLTTELAATEAKAEQVAKADERRRMVARQKDYRSSKRDSKGSR